MTDVRYVYRRGRLIAVAPRDRDATPVVAVIDWWRHGGDRPHRVTPPSSTPVLPLLTVIRGRGQTRRPIERPRQVSTDNEVAS